MTVTRKLKCSVGFMLELRIIFQTIELIRLVSKSNQKFGLDKLETYSADLILSGSSLALARNDL